VGAYRSIFKAPAYAAALSQAAVCYLGFVVVVGRSGSCKTALLRTITHQTQIPLLNLGLDLSREFLPVTFRERKLKASDIIAEILDAQDSQRRGADNSK
jgi:hypothetical protein